MINDTAVRNVDIAQDAPASIIGDVSQFLLLKDRRQASSSTTAVNMLCAIVGIGVLTIPLAFNQASIVGGVLACIICAVYEGFTMFLVVDACEQEQVYSFRGLLRAAGGPVKAKLFDVLYAVSSWGVLVVFVRISAEQLVHVMKGIPGCPTALRSEIVWLCVASLIYGGASSRRHMKELRFTSWTGFLIIIYIVLLLVARFFQGYYSHPNGSIVAPDVNYDDKIQLQIFKALATLSGAFGCQYSVPLLFEELVDSKSRPRQMKRVVCISLTIVLLMYITTGVVGLLMFGNSLVVSKKGDILSCFRNSDIAVDVARASLFFHFMGSYPVYCVSGRKAINFLFVSDEDTISMGTILFEVFALVVSSSVAAYFIPGIGVGFGLNCALFGSFIVSIVPCYVYLSLVKADHATRSTRIKRFFAYIAGGIGCLVTVLGVYEWSTEL